MVEKRIGRLSFIPAPAAQIRSISIDEVSPVPNQGGSMCA